MSSPKQSTDTSILADELLGTTLSELSSQDGGGSKESRQTPPGDETDVRVPNAFEQPAPQRSGDEGDTNESQDGSNSGTEKLVGITDDVGSTEGKGVQETHVQKEETTADQTAMETSTATLKPEADPSTVSPHHLSPGDQTYRDPTPKTPVSSRPPSRSGSNAAAKQNYLQPTTEPERSPTRSDADFDEKNTTSEDERDTNSRTEIQSIMDQFSEVGQGPGHEEVMSPRLELASPLLASPMQHPPRKSSLEPLIHSTASLVHASLDSRLPSSSSLNTQVRDESDTGPAVPPKSGSIPGFGPSLVQDDRYVENSVSPPLHRPPPPEPEPEPDLPFDFHRFLEQLRHRTADPVAKFLRSFLQEFGKKQWMVHEQVKIISDFLLFITNKMAQCDVWRDVSDAEFANAREGMEKLVMNRLYTQTFSPAIPPPQPIPGSKPKRKGGERPMGPGRRGQHQEDVERDDILAQKIGIYGWVRERHLDIPAVGDSGKRFLVLAQQGGTQ